MSGNDPGFIAGAMGGIAGFMTAIGFNWRRESKNAIEIKEIGDKLIGHIEHVSNTYPTITSMNDAFELHLKPVTDSVDRLCDRVSNLCNKIDALEDREREYLKERK